MADGLILEFDGFGVEKYEQVNELLGIDMNTGEGDWPGGDACPHRRGQRGRLGCLRGLGLTG
jgi:hypothetical protein